MDDHKFSSVDFYGDRSPINNYNQNFFIPNSFYDDAPPDWLDYYNDY